MPRSKKYAKTHTRRSGRGDQISLQLGAEKRLTRKRKQQRRATVSSEPEGGVRDGIFQPSLRQEALLRALADYDDERFSITRLCRRAGISREAFYAWRRSPGFLDWFHSYRNSLLRSDLLFVDRVVINKALRGELAAARLLYEKLGELYRRTSPDTESQRIGVVSPDEAIRLYMLAGKFLEPMLKERGLGQTSATDQDDLPSEPEPPID
jgi:hypothetical protein